MNVSFMTHGKYHSPIAVLLLVNEMCNLEWKTEENRVPDSDEKC